MRVRSGDSPLLGVCELLVGLLFDVLVLSNMLGLSVLLLPCLGLFAFFASAVARFAPALLVAYLGIHRGRQSCGVSGSRQVGGGWGSIGPCLPRELTCV